MKPKKFTAWRLRPVTGALIKAMAQQADVTQTRWIEDTILALAIVRLGADRVQAIVTETQQEATSE